MKPNKQIQKLQQLTEAAAGRAVEIISSEKFTDGIADVVHKKAEAAARDGYDHIIVTLEGLSQSAFGSQGPYFYPLLKNVTVHEAEKDVLEDLVDWFVIHMEGLGFTVVQPSDAAINPVGLFSSFKLVWDRKDPYPALHAAIQEESLRDTGKTVSFDTIIKSSTEN